MVDQHRFAQKRIIKLNTQKMNVSQKFKKIYKTFPTEYTTKWNVEEQDIEKIVKLRNDIVHANVFEVSNQQLEQYSAFLEILIFFY